MPKLKTREAAEKRITRTRKGKMMRGHAYSSHLKTKKRKSRIRRQKEPTAVAKADIKNLRKLLPYV